MNSRKSPKAPILIIGLFLLLAVTYVINIDNFSKWSLISGLEAPAAPFKIGTNTWLGFEPLYLARDLGYYQNSPIKLVEYTSSTQVHDAYRSHKIHVAALTLEALMQYLEEGYDPRIILVMDFSTGGDAILAKPNIKNLEDLRGRKVGVENTPYGAVFLSDALNTVGLNQSDVNRVTSPIDEQERMFLENKLDAVVTWDPVRSHLLAADAHQIFGSSQLSYKIFTILVIPKDTLERFPEEVDTLLKGWFKALDFFEKQPKEAAFLMSRRLKILPEEIPAAYKGLKFISHEENLKFMMGSKTPLKKSAARIAQIMLRSKLLQKEVSLKGILYPSALKNIDASALTAPSN